MSCKENYIKRLKIPIYETRMCLYSSSGELLLTGYRRIVIGGRGPYIECDSFDVVNESFVILDNVHHYYYIEARSIRDNVKLYIQKHTVDYADYKVGMCYISPFDLVDKDGNPVIDGKDSLVFDDLFEHQE